VSALRSDRCCDELLQSGSARRDASCSCALTRLEWFHICGRFVSCTRKHERLLDVGFDNPNGCFDDLLRTHSDNAVFWGVGHLRPLPPATDHATKCSRTIVSELIGSVNTSVFLVTYLVRLPTTGLGGSQREFTSWRVSSGIEDQSACSGRHVGALFMIDRTYMTKCALNFLSGCS